MINKKDILDLETKNKIYNFISKYPGLHLRELSRQLDIPKTTMDYHLSYLQKQGLIKKVVDGREHRYFTSEDISDIDKNILNIIRRKAYYDVIFFIYRNYRATQERLSTKLNKSRSTISRRLNKLIELKIVEQVTINNTTFFRLVNQEELTLFFITYRTSFFDKNLSKNLEHADKNYSKIWCIEMDRVIKHLNEILPGLNTLWP